MAADLVDGLVSRLAASGRRKNGNREAMLGLLASTLEDELAPVVADGLGPARSGAGGKAASTGGSAECVAAQTTVYWRRWWQTGLAQLDPGRRKAASTGGSAEPASRQTGTFMVAELVDGWLGWTGGRRKSGKPGMLCWACWPIAMTVGWLQGLAEELTRFDWGPEEKRRARDALLGLLANCNGAVGSLPAGRRADPVRSRARRNGKPGMLCWACSATSKAGWPRSWWTGGAAHLDAGGKAGKSVETCCPFSPGKQVAPMAGRSGKRSGPG